MIVISPEILAKNCYIERCANMIPFYENKEKKLQISPSLNLEFPEHLHGHTEILFVREGHILVNIMGKSGELKKGDCAVIFPQEIHSYHSLGGCLGWLLIFGDSLAGPYLRSLREYSPDTPFLSAGQLHEDVALAFERLYEISCRPTNLPDAAGDGQSFVRPDDHALSSAWIQVLLANIAPLLSLQKNQAESMDLTYRLVHYIMEHFQEPLTLDLLSKELHVNKYYLSHIFSGRLHMNFRQYLNRIRLEYAMQLIRSTREPLTRVWENAGFNSQRSFNRVFQETVGMTPLEYRYRENPGS